MSAQVTRYIPFQPTSHSQVGLSSRCQALESEDQGNENVAEGPFGLEGSSMAEQPTPCITTPLLRQKEGSSR